MKAVVREMPARWLEERQASDASQWDEVWDGVLHMAPMPNRVHQRLIRDLQELLQRRWAEPIGGQVDQEANVTSIDGTNWTDDYRIPDLVMMPPDRAHFDKVEFIAGPPLVCIEAHSPGDETYEKPPFYLKLGVPEIWIIHRDSKKPELYRVASGKYEIINASADGWIHSSVAGIALKSDGKKLHLLFDGDAETEIVPK